MATRTSDMRLPKLRLPDTFTLVHIKRKNKDFDLDSYISLYPRYILHLDPSRSLDMFVLMPKSMVKEEVFNPLAVEFIHNVVHIIEAKEAYFRSDAASMIQNYGAHLWTPTRPTQFRSSSNVQETVFYILNKIGTDVSSDDLDKISETVICKQRAPPIMWPDMGDAGPAPRVVFDRVREPSMDRDIRPTVTPVSDPIRKAPEAARLPPQHFACLEYQVNTHTSREFTCAVKEISRQIGEARQMGMEQADKIAADQAKSLDSSLTKMGNSVVGRMRNQVEGQVTRALNVALERSVAATAEKALSGISSRVGELVERAISDKVRELLERQLAELVPAAVDAAFKRRAEWDLYGPAKKRGWDARD